MKILALLFAICILIGGCAKTQDTVSKSTVDTTQSGYSFSFSDGSNIEIVSFSNAKVLYRKDTENSLEYYILDAETGKHYLLSAIDNCVMIGRGCVTQDGVLYFYQAEVAESGLKNVLYAVDFKNMEMSQISENMYDLKLIPMFALADCVGTLQMKKEADGHLNSFVECFDREGQLVNTIELNYCKIPSFSGYDAWNVIDMHADEKYIYTIEAVDDSDRVFYVIYDLEFNYILSYEISELFGKYVDSVGVFYAFGDYFSITDASCNTVVCQIIDDKVKVILNGYNLEYAVNRAVRSDIEYFYQRGTNDIYKLYITSGKLYKQEYDTDNTNTVISQVMSDNGRLLIVKKKLNESQNKEKFCYVMETEDQD